MKLIVVSNRLPVRLSQNEEGHWQAGPSSGGLVTAMAPVLHQRGGLWIGWPGDEVDEGAVREPLARLSEEMGCQLETVSLTAEEAELYYLGFSNEVLWPLFHDLQTRAHFEEAYWEAYQTVNRKFAVATAGHAGDDDVIWVHDYHLMGVAGGLRAAGLQNRIVFFLHTPFPSPDIFAKLPWRGQVVRDLLQHDTIGFHTDRDVDNFLRCVHHFVSGAEITASDGMHAVRLEGREVRAGAFPISIDYEQFASLAATDEVEREMQRLREQFDQRHIVLGVDRLDYTKGIPHRLRAFRRALERFEELRERIVLVQVVIPSRDGIPEYAALKTEVEQLVGEINGAHSQAGWTPVHYVYRGLPQPELVAYYRAAPTMLVTPLKDGMNLVAKEYCASSVDESGALILSEFAGAAAQFDGAALLVNPYDTEGLAGTLRTSFHMDAEERRRRMRMLRQNVKVEDIFWWVDSFLKAARLPTPA